MSDHCDLLGRMATLQLTLLLSLCIVAMRTTTGEDTSKWAVVSWAIVTPTSGIVVYMSQVNETIPNPQVMISIRRSTSSVLAGNVDYSCKSPPCVAYFVD